MEMREITRAISLDMRVNYVKALFVISVVFFHIALIFVYRSFRSSEQN